MLNMLSEFDLIPKISRSRLLVKIRFLLDQGEDLRLALGEFWDYQNFEVNVLLSARFSYLS